MRQGHLSSSWIPEDLAETYLERYPVLKRIGFDEFLPKKEYFLNQTPEHYSEGVHGWGHCARTCILALELGIREGVKGDLLTAVWAAAYLHDLGRNEDGADYGHGKRAVDQCWKKVLPLFEKAGLKEEYYEAVKTAVEWHDKKEELPESINGIIKKVTNILKDADALDRWRVGEENWPEEIKERHLPNKEILRTGIARGVLYDLSQTFYGELKSYNSEKRVGEFLIKVTEVFELQGGQKEEGEKRPIASFEIEGNPPPAGEGLSQGPGGF